MKFNLSKSKFTLSMVAAMALSGASMASAQDIAEPEGTDDAFAPPLRSAEASAAGSQSRVFELAQPSSSSIEANLQSQEETQPTMEVNQERSDTAGEDESASLETSLNQPGLSAVLASSSEEAQNELEETPLTSLQRHQVQMVTGRGMTASGPQANETDVTAESWEQLKELAQGQYNDYKSADRATLKADQRAYYQQMLEELDLLLQASPDTSDPLTLLESQQKLQTALDRLQLYTLIKGEERTGLKSPVEPMKKATGELNSQTTRDKLTVGEIQDLNQLVDQVGQLVLDEPTNQPQADHLLTLKSQLQKLQNAVPRELTQVEQEMLASAFIETQNTLRIQPKSSGVPVAIQMAHEELQQQLEAQNTLIQEALKGQESLADEDARQLRAKLDEAIVAYQNLVQQQRDYFDVDYTEGESDQEYNVYLNKNGFPNHRLDKDSYYITNNALVDLTWQLVSNHHTGPVTMVVDMTKAPEAQLELSSFNLFDYQNAQATRQRVGNNYAYRFDNIATTFSTFRMQFRVMKADFHEAVNLNVKLYQGDISFDEVGTIIGQPPELAARTIDFIITQSGYKSQPHLGPGAGFAKPGHPQYSNPYAPAEDDYGQNSPNRETPLDPGETDADGRVIDNEQLKTIPFLHELLKDLKFKDTEGLIAAGPADPIKLDHVKIKVAVPESEGVRAKHILNQAGLNFVATDDGQYLVLTLDMAKIAASHFEVIPAQGDQPKQLKVGDQVYAFTPVEGVYEYGGKRYYVDAEANRYPLTTTVISPLKLASADTGYYLDPANRLFFQEGDQAAEEIGLLKGQRLVNLEGQDLIYDQTEQRFKPSAGQQLHYLRLGDQLLAYEQEYRSVPETAYVVRDSNNQPILKENIIELEGPIIEKEGRFFGRLLTEVRTYVADQFGTIVDGADWQEHAIFDENGKYLPEVLVTEENGQKTVTYEGQKYYLLQTGSAEHPMWGFYTSPDLGEDQQPLVAPARLTLKYHPAIGIKDGIAIEASRPHVTNDHQIVVVDRFNRVIQSYWLKKDGTTYTMVERVEDGTSPREQVLGPGQLDFKLLESIGPHYVGPGNQIEDATKFLDKSAYLLNQDKQLVAKDRDKHKQVLPDSDTWYDNLIAFDLQTRTQLSYQDQSGQVVELAESILEDLIQANPDQIVTDGSDYYIYSLVNGVHDLYHHQGELHASSQAREYITQTLSADRKKTIEGQSIYDLVLQTMLNFQFPGFVTGTHVHHSYRTEWEATYKDTADGLSKSIFKDREGRVVGSFLTFHTFRLKSKPEPPEFNKMRPDAIQGMDSELFNLIYRHENDRERDGLLQTYFHEEKRHTLTEEQLAKVERLKTAFYDSFRLELTPDNWQALNRLMSWTLSYNNKQHGLSYPETTESRMIWHDSGLDRRLVYDQLIFNAPKKIIEELKQAADDQGSQEHNGTQNLDTNQATRFDEKQFNPKLFAIDQIDQLRLGVNPSLVGYDFTTVDRLKSDVLMAEFDRLYRGETSDWMQFDKTTGQVRIDLFKYFYDQSGSSPIINQYLERLRSLRKGINGLEDSATTNDLIGVVKDYYRTIDHEYGQRGDQGLEQYKCFDLTIKELEELPNTVEQAAKLKADALAYLNRIDALFGTDLHNPYNQFNGQFNAFELVFKEGVQVPAKQTKQVLVTSVIKPNVSIPVTDAYGRPLSNREMYFQQIFDSYFDSNKKLAADIQGQPGTMGKAFDDLADAERKALYDQVNRHFITDGEVQLADPTVSKKIKDLVTPLASPEYGEQYRPLRDQELTKLAIDDLVDAQGRPLQSRYGSYINPNFVMNKAKQLIRLSDLEIDKIGSLDLAAYYNHPRGYNGVNFANKALEYLVGLPNEINPWESHSSWKRIYCPPGLTKCFEESGESGDGGPGSKQSAGATKHFTENDFNITYPPIPSPSYEEENKITKRVQDQKPVYQEGDSIDFDIKVQLDLLTREDLINKRKTEEGTAETDLSEADQKRFDPGADFTKIKDGYLLDILPPELDFDNGKTQVIVKVNWRVLQLGGANHQRFNGDAAAEQQFKEDFEKNIHIELISEVNQYDFGKLAEQKGFQAYLAQLAQSSNQAGTGGYQGRRAILIKFPEFEAPSQTGVRLPAFELTLKQLKVTESLWGLKNNKVTFTSTPWFGSDQDNFLVGGESRANKYVRWYERKQVSEEAADANAGQAEGSTASQLEEFTPSAWYQGTARVKFGQRIDYKLEYTYKVLDTASAGQSAAKADLVLTDELPQAGIRPILVGEVVPEQDYAAKFRVLYFVKDSAGNERGLSYAEVQERLADVTRIEIQQADGVLNNGDTVSFIIPMQVPKITLKIDEQGKPILDEAGHPQYEYLDRVQLDNLLAKNHFESNEDIPSNEVKVRIDEPRLLQLRKVWQDATGQPLTQPDPLAQVTIDIYQSTSDYDEVEDKAKTLAQLIVAGKVKIYQTITLSADNHWQTLVDNLPYRQKAFSFKQDAQGNITETIVEEDIKYHYFINERDLAGWTSRIIDQTPERDTLTITYYSIINRSTPPTPPEKPEEPGKPDEPPTPPEEPEEPGKPEEPPTPPEEPEEPGNPEEPPIPPEKPEEPVNPVPEESQPPVVPSAALPATGESNYLVAYGMALMSLVLGVCLLIIRRVD